MLHLCLLACWCSSHDQRLPLAQLSANSTPPVCACKSPYNCLASLALCEREREKEKERDREEGEKREEREEEGEGEREKEREREESDVCSSDGFLGGGPLLFLITRILSAPPTAI